MGKDGQFAASRRRGARASMHVEPVRILFVCTGNICRSPTAELMLRARFPASPGLVVESAGIGALVSHGVAAEMRPALEARGIDSSGFRARQITGDMIERSDLIVTMTRHHRDWILEEWPHAVRSVVPLGAIEQLARTGPPSSGSVTAWRHSGGRGRIHDVRDPYGKDPRVADAVSRVIEEQVEVLAGWLRGTL